MALPARRVSCFCLQFNEPPRSLWLLAAYLQLCYCVGGMFYFVLLLFETNPLQPQSFWERRTKCNL